jgi:DNA-binding Lrp family transcriptional regulator
MLYKKSTFIRVFEELFHCGLTHFEILLVAEIFGYQNNGQKYYMSKMQISERYDVSRRHVINTFKKLTELGIVKENGTIGNNVTCYKIDTQAVKRVHSSCNLSAQQAVTWVPPSCEASAQNKTIDKTSNKTNNNTRPIFPEGDSNNISNEDLSLFAQTIDIQ